MSKIDTPEKARYFVEAHTFVEPAVGAGSLFFSFIEKLFRTGLRPSDITSVHFDLVDVNPKALNFIQEEASNLRREKALILKNLNFLNSNFLDHDFKSYSKPPVIFGNPPFVTNQRGQSRWKNCFADFLDRSLQIAGEMGSIQLIVPLSLTFSRDYRELRRSLIAKKGVVAFSNFDNVPDTLFKYGKPNQINTNKANSQRCTIVTSIPSSECGILSTRLNRWSKKDRRKVLSTPPIYFDVTKHLFDGQIPRPENSQVLKYLKIAVSSSDKVATHLSKEGRYKIHVAGVARNFIGIRENSGSSVNILRFADRTEFYRIFIVLTSDLFFDYWRTVGDGFHVTKSAIINFPIHEKLLSGIDSELPAASKLWRLRNRFSKFKINSGIFTQSYDFSDVSVSLYPVVKDIIFSPSYATNDGTSFA